MAESPVTCPICERQVVIRKDGKMRQHQAWLSSRGGALKEWPPPCRGAHKTYNEAVGLAQGESNVR